MAERVARKIGDKVAMDLVACCQKICYHEGKRQKLEVWL